MKHKKDISFILISTLFFAGCGAIGSMVACLIVAILAPLLSFTVPTLGMYLVVITIVTVIGAVIGLVDGLRNS